jgi:hypothetical protein
VVAIISCEEKKCGRTPLFHLPIEVKIVALLSNMSFCHDETRNSCCLSKFIQISFRSACMLIKMVLSVFDILRLFSWSICKKDRHGSAMTVIIALTVAAVNNRGSSIFSNIGAQTWTLNAVPFGSPEKES